MLISQLTLARFWQFSWLVLVLVSVAVAISFGVWWLRRKRWDFRFAGSSAGVIPKDFKSKQQVLDAQKVAIPPSPTRPGGSLAEVCFLANGQVRRVDLAATLVDLAVRGVIQLVVTDGVLSAKLIDQSLVVRDHEQVLIAGIFANRFDDWVKLPDGVDLVAVFEAGKISVRNQVADSGWFADFGATFKNSVLLAVGLSVLLGLCLWFNISGKVLLAGLVPVAPFLVMLMVVNSHSFLGRRSGLGRALVDRWLSFGAYLNTSDVGEVSDADLPWAGALVDLANDFWQSPVEISGSWLLIASRSATVADVGSVLKVLSG